MALAPPSLLEEKRTLRLTMRERRRALPSDERTRRSQQAVARLLALPELGRPGTVAGFSALPEEIDPAPALTALRERGARVALPKVIPGDPRLRFHRALEGAELRPGPFGILEPDSSAPEVDPRSIDLVLVPGLAFDAQGRRLGFGGGYYDDLAGAVERDRGVVLIGLGFDFQVVERCPAGEADAVLDLVVTDARVLRAKEGSP